MTHTVMAQNALDSSHFNNICLKNYNCDADVTVHSLYCKVSFTCPLFQITDSFDCPS